MVEKISQKSYNGVHSQKNLLMSKNHVPDGKTQVVLAQLRWIHRRYDIQRRSANKQFYDETSQFLTEQVKRTIHTLYPQSAQHIANAHMLSQDMLVKIEANKKTLQRVSEFWSQNADNPSEQAKLLYNEWIEKYKAKVKELEDEPCYFSRLTGWATDEIYHSKNQVPDVNVHLYIDPVSDDMPQKQQDHIKREAYINRNNAISTMVTSKIRLEAIETIVEDVKHYWANTTNTSLETITELLDKNTKEQADLLLENEEYLKTLDEYLFNRFNYRHTDMSSAHATPNVSSKSPSV